MIPSRHLLPIVVALYAATCMSQAIAGDASSAQHSGAAAPPSENQRQAASDGRAQRIASAGKDAETANAPPDTPVGRQLAAWLKAFNTGDEAVITRFHDENMTEALRSRQKLERLIPIAHNTGGFQYLSKEESTATRLTGTMKARSKDMTARFIFEVEPNSPYKISRLEVIAQD